MIFSPSEFSSGLCSTAGIATALTLVLLTGCSTEPRTPSADASQPDGDIGGPDAYSDTDGDASDAGPPDGGFSLGSIYSATANGFATSKSCKGCHTNQPGISAMRDDEGRGVAPFDLWQASMMANATRDPFWRAMVSAEVKASPGAKKEIQDKCMRCHAPMAYTATRRRGNSQISPDALHAGGSLEQLALDGVSCTGCHSITPENLGKEASFTGHFVANDQKKIYGPHADPYAMPMEQNSGFEPVQSDHMRDSGLCGSCHTLYTQPIDESGEPTAQGHFAEQTPFLEWRNSSYSTESPGNPKQTCQDCHEPSTDREGDAIKTQIAVSKLGFAYPEMQVPKRSPYGRHLFVGGNTLIPAIIRDNADQLNPIASTEAFNELIDRVKRQLRNRTATVELASTNLSGGQLTVQVETTNLTGHKFPTGYPSRRAWLHVQVVDARGDTIFESGGYDDIGQLLDARDQPLPTEQPDSGIVPHRQTITSDDEVQIYQSVMQNASGEPTWRLMRAADYFKDNRLLPDGWSTSHPSIDDMEAVGTEGDTNFTGGSDRTTYDIQLPGDATSPYTITVELRYQTLTPRFARALFETDTPAVNRFERYWRNADRTPSLIDRTERQIQ